MKKTILKGLIEVMNAQIERKRIEIDKIDTAIDEIDKWQVKYNLENNSYDTIYGCLISKKVNLGIEMEYAKKQIQKYEEEIQKLKQESKQESKQGAEQ